MIVALIISAKNIVECAHEEEPLIKNWLELYSTTYRCLSINKFYILYFNQICIKRIICGYQERIY
ncbi:hypothetical protein VU03_01500, partial [Desulfobulbus sp. N3]|nr:hypothetical protein [Desulfobulbus sp. N3]